MLVLMQEQVLCAGQRPVLELSLGTFKMVPFLFLRLESAVQCWDHSKGLAGV